MLLVALTGGIGAGKSSVGRLLAARGAGLIDTDQVARDVVEPGQPAHAEIIAAFGEAVLGSDRRLDRAKLAAVVFADPAARLKLEGFTHPRIAGEVARRVAEFNSQGRAIVVVEVPLLFECGWEKSYPVVVVVSVDVEAAVRRLHGRGLGEAEARARIAAQMPLAEKAARADYVVDNSGSPADLEREVDRLWAELKRRAGQSK